MGVQKIVPAALIVRAAGLKENLNFSVQNGAFSDIKLTIFHQKLCHACPKSGGYCTPHSKKWGYAYPFPPPYPSHSTPMPGAVVQRKTEQENIVLKSLIYAAAAAAAAAKERLSCRGTGQADIADTVILDDRRCQQ